MSSTEVAALSQKLDARRDEIVEKCMAERGFTTKRKYDPTLAGLSLEEWMDRESASGESEALTGGEHSKKSVHRDEDMGLFTVSTGGCLGIADEQLFDDPTSAAIAEFKYVNRNYVARVLVSKAYNIAQGTFENCQKDLARQPLSVTVRPESCSKVQQRAEHLEVSYADDIAATVADIEAQYTSHLKSALG